MRERVATSIELQRTWKMQASDSVRSLRARGCKLEEGLAQLIGPWRRTGRGDEIALYGVRRGGLAADLMSQLCPQLNAKANSAV